MVYVINARAVRAAMAQQGIRGFAALARRTGVHRNTLGRFFSKLEPVLPESVSRVLDELKLDPSVAIERVEAARFDAAADKLLVELADALMESHPMAAYVLFGSRARGDARRYSDFDIGVFSRDGLGTERYLALLDVKERVEDDIPWFIDLVNLNNADPAFLRNIAGDMRFLAGRQGDWQSLQMRCANEQ